MCLKDEGTTSMPEALTQAAVAISSAMSPIDHPLPVNPLELAPQN